MVKCLGLYDAWSSFLDFAPSAHRPVAHGKGVTNPGPGSEHSHPRTPLIVILGELVGTQRKKAEHAMFENQFERRVSSTKRVRNAKAKTRAEDHTTPF